MHSITYYMYFLRLDRCNAYIELKTNIYCQAEDDNCCFLICISKGDKKRLFLSQTCSAILATSFKHLAQG